MVTARTRRCYHDNDFTLVGGGKRIIVVHKKLIPNNTYSYIQVLRMKEPSGSPGGHRVLIKIVDDVDIAGLPAEAVMTAVNRLTVGE